MRRKRGLADVLAGVPDQESCLVFLTQNWTTIPFGTLTQPMREVNTQEGAEGDSEFEEDESKHNGFFSGY